MVEGVDWLTWCLRLLMQFWKHSSTVQPHTQGAQGSLYYFITKIHIHVPYSPLPVTWIYSSSTYRVQFQRTSKFYPLQALSNVITTTFHSSLHNFFSPFYQQHIHMQVNMNHNTTWVGDGKAAIFLNTNEIVLLADPQDPGQWDRQSIHHFRNSSEIPFKMFG